MGENKEMYRLHFRRNELLATNLACNLLALVAIPMRLEVSKKSEF